MGVPNQLLAVGWGYAGNKSTEMIFILCLVVFYFNSETIFSNLLRGISSILRHSYMNLIPDSDCQKVFGSVDNANTICLAYPDAGACTVRNYSLVISNYNETVIVKFLRLNIQYDVGSPILSNDQKQVIGVIGKNMRCGGGEPIVAVDIRRYWNWSPMSNPYYQ
jgi:hypothetical protein